MSDLNFQCSIYTGSRTTLVDRQAAEQNTAKEIELLYESSGVIPRKGDKIKVEYVEIEEAGYFVAEVDSVTFAFQQNEAFVNITLMSGHGTL